MRAEPATRSLHHVHLAPPGPLDCTCDSSLLGQLVVAFPWLSGLVLLGIGLVAGVAVGRLAHPPRDHVRAAVGLTAAFGLVSFLVLRLIVQLRLPEGSAATAVAWVVGSLVVVLVQSVVVVVTAPTIEPRAGLSRELE